jgi:GDP-fucose transporter C1
MWAIGIIIAGSLHYTWVKHFESQQASSKGKYERVSLEAVEAGSGTSPKVTEAIRRTSIASEQK